MKNSKQEIWRDIPGYEGYYQVSDEGRVRSLSRTMLTKNGVERFYKGRFFEDSLSMNGYKQVTLSREGKQETFLIHQLVAMVFLDHEPNGNNLVVDHIDGDKLNNRIENLQIVTHRDNLSTCYRTNEDSLTSSFAGVHFCKTSRKWRADIVFHNKQIYLGRFESELEASDIYQKSLGEINNNTFNPEYYKPSFTSKHKGVYFHKASQKWRAQPTINGKQIYLGYHSTEEGAYQAIQNKIS